MTAILLQKDCQAPEVPGTTFGGLFYDDQLKQFCQIDSNGNITCLGQSPYYQNPVLDLVNLVDPILSGPAAGDRYIVEDISTPDVSWGILPSGLENGDIIQRNPDNTAWIIALNASETGPGVLTYAESREDIQYYTGLMWCQINPNKRLEKTVTTGTQETIDQLEVIDFTATQWNITVSYLDGSRRIFQSVFATHEDGTTPSHNITSIVGSQRTFFDYEIDVTISSGSLNLIIVNNSLVNDYKIQVKRIPVENF